MADNDDAYKDDVAPEKGSPYRPLYDDKILFNGQPVALVLAEDWETARFAASLVRVEYQKRAARHRSARAARARHSSSRSPRSRAAMPTKAFAAAAVRHEAEYFIPTEHHNPMELFASTAIWDGRQAHGLRQDARRAERAAISLRRVRDAAGRGRVMSPYMGGGFGAGLRPQYQVVLAVLGARALKRPVRVVLTRAQMYALGYRPATIERLALGANAGGTLDAITHEAIAVTSQFEEFSRNDTGWAGLLYKSPNAKFVHKLARLDVPTSSDMRAPGAATGVYALECAMDELAVALKTRSGAIAAAMLLRPRPERRTFPTPASSCANATGRARRRSAGTSATPNRARCATAANWSAGAWRPAYGKRCRCRPRSASC